MVKTIDNTNLLQGIQEVCVLYLLSFYNKHIEDPLPDDDNHDHNHQSSVFNGFDQSLAMEDSRLAVKSSKTFCCFLFVHQGDLLQD